MVRSRASALGIVALAGLAAAQPAHATLFTYHFAQGAPGAPAPENAGGYIDSINTTFDSVSKHMTFSVAFGPATGQTWLSTHGFWLALDNGPAPVSRANETAIFYFDAANLATPRLAAYTYNGNGTQDSYKSGDLIMGAWDPGWINSLTATDTSTPSGLRRVLSFDIDATSIINHVPMVHGANPWSGTGFGSQIGMWLYSVQGYAATYSGTHGGIGALSFTSPGWLSFGNAAAQVPGPGAAALLGLSGVLAARRRRPVA